MLFISFDLLAFDLAQLWLKPQEKIKIHVRSNFSNMPIHGSFAPWNIGTDTAFFYYKKQQTEV